MLCWSPMGSVWSWEETVSHGRLAISGLRRWCRTGSLAFPCMHLSSGCAEVGAEEPTARQVSVQLLPLCSTPWLTFFLPGTSSTASPMCLGSPGIVPHGNRGAEYLLCCHSCQ